MQNLGTIDHATRPPTVGFDASTAEFPRHMKWKSDEYYRLAELGFFEGMRVELLEGEIFTMAPMGSPHATGIAILVDVLKTVFGEGYFLRIQSPLDVDEYSQPEPDVAVLLGSPRDYSAAHPKTVLLAVEVSDSSLGLDRNIKTRLYAQSSINEYWILNLKDRCLEVYRKPVSDSDLGFIYSEQKVIHEAQSVAPQAKADKLIKVADLLP